VAATGTTVAPWAGSSHPGQTRAYSLVSRSLRRSERTEPVSVWTCHDEDFGRFDPL